MMKIKTIIIAEAGVNHNGSIEKAKKLIDVATDAGADYIKFQAFKADGLVNKTAKRAAYQSLNVADNDNSQYAMLKKLELSDEMHQQLWQYCLDKEIQFLSTGFDEGSIDYLDQLGLQMFKIPSGEITNKPYLRHIASKGKPVILSTGMANLQEIRDALQVLYNGGLNKHRVTLLHCNTEYPTPMEDVNLKAMLTIQQEFGVRVGYSDHTLGIEVPIAALAMGAQVIEKHFTLDRNLPGPDHRASLEPDELKAMVAAIRNVELAISGSGVKEPSKSEKPNIPIARKSIHLNEDLSAGTILEAKHLIMIRPGSGISPMDVDRVVGKRLLRNLFHEDILKWEDLE